MFCSRCGTKLDDNAKLCTNCGLDLAPTTPVKAIASGEVTERDIVAQALAAEYELLEELGRGGMAIVYRAKDLQLEREVAIKVLPFSLAFDAEFVERFQREARTAAGLEHPNIIPIYRVGKAGRVTYFVMKFLRGQALSQLLHDRGKLHPPEIRRLLIEAGGAIGYAAKRGIVHRDIKPDNIMFDEHGVGMVADFGIAKAASGQKLTGTGMSIGTPHYMSPEQARAQNTDGRSDIYSLGVVAYQCLTGKVPYDGEDSFAIGYKHIMEPIPIPDLETPDERRLFEIVKRMIQKQPSDRYQTCDEMVAALDGQQVAQAGTIRGSGGALRPVGRPSNPGQATTPMPQIEERSTARRPVMRRQKNNSPAVLWTMLLLLGGVAAAAGYYFLALPKRDAAALADSTVTDSIAQAAVELPPADTTAGLADSTAPALAASDSSPTAIATADSSASPEAAVIDSGAIRLTGLPRGTRVMVDENPINSAAIKLAPGKHVLAISAPRFQFFTDTVDIEPGVVLDVKPNLLPMTGPVQQRRQQRAAGTQPAGTTAPTCDEPGAGYNLNRACFDQRPRPVNPPFITLTPEIDGTPRSSVLLIKVSAEGKTLEVRPFNPSNDAAFERLARQHAITMEWKPAQKDGAPVIGWTQMAFPPQSQ